MLVLIICRAVRASIKNAMVIHASLAAARVKKVADGKRYYVVILI